MARTRQLTIVLIATLAVGGGAWWYFSSADVPTGEPGNRPSSAADEPESAPEIGRMVLLPRAAFRMGSNVAPEGDRRPAHDVTVGPFWIDTHEVTNGQFAAFVDATDYVTTAEAQGWSMTWDEADEQWRRTDGVDWRHPFGPHSHVTGRERYPVVHVSWFDAAAYAQWAEKRLPTEAEWEYAARAGLRDAPFPWGDEERPIDPTTGRRTDRANTRQHDAAPDADGFAALAPVGAYPPNDFGLYDMTGNCWEWCGDWYGSDYYAASPAESPAGPSEGQQRVLRGGSWLSPEQFRVGHHVDARWHRRPETTTGHIGFRCVRDADN